MWPRAHDKTSQAMG